MSKSFFFYDLETSGLSAREDRIMQFAGIRTDENFEPIGEPYNLLVALNDDTLPSPGALMVTGITPQKTLEEGYSEADFCKILIEKIFIPDTCVVGFNNIRFDDEFIRYTLWRNFYDPYEWAYKEGRSRWDLLDVVRMTRALRPDGIEWPVDADGKASNRLELLTKSNGLAHEKAHDALSDVEALIAVTKLIHDKQPQLFDYLFKLRDKNEVKKLVNLETQQPFVYVSGRFDGEFNKATVALPIASAANGNVLVYDLRYDPSIFVDLDEKALAAKVFATWEERKAEGFVALPVKVLQYNHAPAVAPLGVLSQENGWEKISLDQETIERHRREVLAHPDFAAKLGTIFERKKDFKKSDDPETQLYDGFVADRDRLRAESVRNATRAELKALDPKFDDPRLKAIYPWYKVRNFPQSATGDDRASYEAHRTDRLERQTKPFMKDMDFHARRTDLSDHQRFVLEELKLWFESVTPEAEG